MPKGFRIIGHRGNGAGPDENTLASCQHAVRNGANAIELDVKLFRGELVLAHDRPTARSAKLQEVLPKLTVPVALHLKRHKLNPLHDRRALLQLSTITHRPGLLVSSFWPGTLRFAKRRFPKLETAFITFWPRWDLRSSRSLGVSDVCTYHRRIDERVASEAKRQRVRLFAFTPHQPDQALRRLADGVITDNVSGWSRAAYGRRRQKAS